MIRRTLDLPAPFGPTTPIFAPGRKASVTSSRTTLSPWALRTLRMEKTYWAIHPAYGSGRSPAPGARRRRRAPGRHTAQAADADAGSRSSALNGSTELPATDSPLPGVDAGPLRSGSAQGSAGPVAVRAVRTSCAVPRFAPYHG